MGNTYIKTLRNLIVSAWVLTFPYIGNAQDAGPWSVIYEGFGYTDSGSDEGGSSNMGTEDTGDGGITFDDNTNDVPVDGGLSLLFAAGAAYGVRRLRGRKSQR